MRSETVHAPSLLASRVAEKYREQGFDVLIQPQPADLPFDLGEYHPDLIVKRGPDENYIIEVKGSVTHTPIDRYREIAELVSQHAGWRFLFVTGEDVAPNGQKNSDATLLSWEQIRKRQMQAGELLALGVVEGAFLSLWAIFEAALRRQAIQASIPIERLPTLSLINHLYSQGELSIEHYESAKELLTVRNSFVHGYHVPNLSEPTRQLQELVAELLELWAPPA